MSRILLIISFLFTDVSLCNAQQDFLMLQKKNPNKNVRYKAGETISFRTKGNDRRITATILAFDDSVIVFKGFNLPVQEITHLYIDEKTRWWLRYKIEQIFLIGGAGYLVLDVLNTGEVSKQTLAISGCAIGVGLLARLLIGNRIRIRGLTRLRIVHLKKFH